MPNRRCEVPGCRAYLKDDYPFSKCHWHFVPGSGIVKAISAIGLYVLGAGGAIAYQKIRDRFKRSQVEAEQNEWREMGERMRQADATREADDPGESKSATG